jgi:hypothetical protein
MTPMSPNVLDQRAVSDNPADRVCVRLNVAGILDQPLRAYGYFDIIGGWVKRPLSLRQQQWMHQHCPGLYCENTVAKFDWHYRQRLQLPQLTEAALRILIDCTHNEMLLNRGEIALDLLFADRPSLGRVADQLPHMLLQPWHTGHGMQAFDDGFVTRRYAPGGRTRGHWMHHYADQPCRIDGHPHCLHLQSCVQGAALLRSRGINRPRDLLDFDFVSYWQQWLRLYQIDLERLGRFDTNSRSGSTRQRRRIKQWGRLAVNLDRMHGGRLYHIHSFADDQRSDADPRSLQTFVGNYRHGRSRPYLTRMPITVSAVTDTYSMGMSRNAPKLSATLAASA